MNEEQMKEKIKELKQIIPSIKNKQTRLQQLKYMHRLQKQLKIYNFYRSKYEKDNSNRF